VLLRLRLFGQMGAEDSVGRSVLPRSRKTRALLAILALAPARPTLRSQIIGLLWSRREKEQARASLRQAVHELQDALKSVGPRCLLADRNHLALSGDRLWVDAVAFCRTGPPQSGPLSWFQGTLLEDLQGIDPAFDRFLADENRRLLQVARTIGDSLLAEPHDADALLEVAEQVLKIDRGHEGAWRAMIAAHAERGERGLALAAFENCRAALAESHRLLPSPETQQLVAGIREHGATRRGLPAVAEPARKSDTVAPVTRGPDVILRLGVMPLHALAGDHDGGLSLGLTEEITTALARFRWISCVSCLSLVVIRDNLSEDSRSWRSLDLDFVLNGTVQRSGNRVRIIVRLTDVHAGGELVWADRFDREIDDLLDLQEEIAAQTVARIDLELLLHESKRADIRRAEVPRARDLLVRAIPTIYRLEQSEFRSAGEMLQDSLAIDPGNASAHAWLAYWHLFQVGQGWAVDPVSATTRAAELAERAVVLDPGDARALTLAGHVRGFLGKRPYEARVLHARAIDLNPNLALAWCFSGLSYSYLGDHPEAIRRMNQAQRLSPRDPHGFFFDTAMIMPHLLHGDYDRAVEVGRRAIELNPGFSSSYKGYLAALGHLGRATDAREARARLMALEPGFSVAQAVARSPLACAEDVTRYAEGLRRAGLPE